MSAPFKDQPNMRLRDPVDWNSLGRRIVEAAGQAATMHARALPVWIIETEEPHAPLADGAVQPRCGLEEGA